MASNDEFEYILFNEHGSRTIILCPNEAISGLWSNKQYATIVHSIKPKIRVSLIGRGSVLDPDEPFEEHEGLYGGRAMVRKLKWVQHDRIDDFIFSLDKIVTAFQETRHLNKQKVVVEHNELCTLVRSIKRNHFIACPHCARQIRELSIDLDGVNFGCWNIMDQKYIKCLCNKFIPKATIVLAARNVFFELANKTIDKLDQFDSHSFSICDDNETLTKSTRLSKLNVKDVKIFRY